jgi:hypothetical protein
MSEEPKPPAAAEEPKPPKLEDQPEDDSEARAWLSKQLEDHHLKLSTSMKEQFEGRLAALEAARDDKAKPSPQDSETKPAPAAPAGDKPRRRRGIMGVLYPGYQRES